MYTCIVYTNTEFILPLMNLQVSCLLLIVFPLYVHLIAILLFLLLELPEVGLDGGGSLLRFHGAERRNGRDSAGPVAGV